METGDQHTDKPPPGPAPAGNVVRLPRDWLGPRDELVKLGPDPAEAAPDANAPEPLREHGSAKGAPATGSSKSLATGPASDWLGPDAELIPLGRTDTSDPALALPGAEHFWGEHSASVQDAVQRPVAPGSAAIEPGLYRAKQGPSPELAGRRRRQAVLATAVALLALAGCVIAVTNGTPVQPSMPAVAPSMVRGAGLPTALISVAQALDRAQATGASSKLRRNAAARRARRQGPSANHNRGGAPVAPASRAVPSTVGSQSGSVAGDSAGNPSSSSSGNPSGGSAGSPSSGGGSGASPSTGGGGGASPSTGGPTGSAPFGPGAPG